MEKITTSLSPNAAYVKQSTDDLSQKCDLKVGDRVMVQSKDNKWIQGTVIFIGSHKNNPEPGPVVGVQLVSI